jgi:WD40 repeat protein
VSSFYVQGSQQQRLIASSGEGTLQTWDLRMNKAEMQSEVYACELNTISAVNEDEKVVVGGSNGIIYIFNQGSYGYHSDMVPGHPGAINSMVSVTENIIVTGCEDGVIRAVHMFPHRFIGQVGHHEGHMPIEKMDVSGQGNLVASTSHDNRVKFWDISYLQDMDYVKKMKPVLKKKGQKKKKIDEVVDKETEHQLPSSGRQNKQEFFKDMQD